MGKGQVALPSGTVTLLLADVEGSVRLWESDPAAMRSTMEALKRVTAEAVASHGGAQPPEQGEGDNLVAAFARASEALATAVEIQTLIERTRWATASPPRMRMALHTGEVAPTDGRYDGEVINRCARIRDAGHGGQLLLSRATQDIIGGRLPESVSVESLGTFQLRDMERPEEVFQVVGAGLVSGSSTLRLERFAGDNLPLQLTKFIGRTDEIASLLEILGETRLLTLTGAGGTGKTRTAIETARAVCEDFEDGVWWVDLAPVTDVSSFGEAIVSSLRLQKPAGVSILDYLAGQLRARRLLLLLDNCEHVVDASAEVVDAVLRTCPGLRVLATSREPLGIVGEVAWRVPPLSLPATKDLPGDAPTWTSDAVDLFVARAQSARPNLTLTEDSWLAVVEICQRLDGLPLAIELAASRVRTMSLGQIADGLDNSSRLLRADRRGVVPRHRTLNACIEWSYLLLDDEHRVVLDHLSVFRGGFTLDAAEAVCCGHVDPVLVLDLVAGLVDRSLVLADDRGDQIRFRLLETIRQFAVARLESRGAVGKARAAHTAYYVELIEHASNELLSTGQEQWFPRFDAERHEIVAALDYAVAAGDQESPLRVVAGIWPYWSARGDVGLARRCIEMAPAHRDTDPKLRANALIGAAQVGRLEYSPDWSYPFCEEALALATEVADEALRGRALSTMGSMMCFAAPVAARSVLAEAIELCTAADDVWFLAIAHFGRYGAHFAAGDCAASIDALETALDVMRAAGDTNNRVAILAILAQSLVFSGDLDKAAEACNEAFAICNIIDSPIWRDWALAVEGSIATWRGDLEAAAVRLDDTVGRARAAATPFLATYLFYRADLDYAKEDFDALDSDLDEALAIWNRVGLEWYAAAQQARRIDALRLAGDRGRAGHLADEQLATTTGSGMWHGMLLAAHSRLLAEGNQSHAEDVAHDAVRYIAQSGADIFLPDLLEDLAGFAIRAKRWEEGTRLLGTAEAARTDMGTTRPASHRSVFDALQSSLRQDHPHDAIEAAWEQGRTMNLVDAVAYAARGRGDRSRPSTGWDSLTPTERQVVDLVAEGLTNPQIGEHMFITAGTVKTHLSSIFRKLALTSRAELAAKAARRPS
jgi:predicted ATPase/DNA-binding NarL/FixJ family response regulator